MASDFTADGQPRLMLIAATDIRTGDIIRAVYDEGITVATAIYPGDRCSDVTRLPLPLLDKAHRATENGEGALRTKRARRWNEPVLIHRTV